MELQRVAAASAYVTFPMLSNTGVPQTGLTVVGDWIAWEDKLGPDAAGNPGFRGLSGSIREIGSSGVYTNALASTELPAASPWVMLRYVSAGVSTQYLLVRTATYFTNVQAFTAGAITTAAFTAGAIDAAAIAANAIGASELATDAVDEIVDAVWDEVILSAHTTDNTTGKAINRLYFATQYLDAAVSTRSTLTGAAAADAVWDEVVLGDHSTDNTAGKVQGRLYFATQYLDAAVSSRSTLTGAAAADAVWDEVILGDHSTDNTAGKMAGRVYFATVYLDAAVSSRSAPATGQTVNVVDTGAITTASFAAGAIDAAAIAANAIGASELAADAVNEIADQVWDEVIYGSHQTDNTAGKVMQRMYHGTDYLVASVLSGSVYADAFLGRTLTRGESGGRTVGQALMAQRNKVTIAAGTLTVFSNDDSTTEWTATVATEAVSAIVTSIDPA